MGSLKEDLEALFSTWKPDAKVLVSARMMADRAPEGLAETSEKTSNHLARLWAYDKVLKMATDRDEKTRQDAVEMAAQYQLVTPVSGAVVLENEKQFKAEGLEPANAAKVPTIPEPETWALIFVAMLIVLFVLWRKRSSCKTG